MTQNYDANMDREEKRIIADRYDLSMDSEKALAMEFVAFRREILEYGFENLRAYKIHLTDEEQNAYKELIK